jgi:hypothetical protein
MNLPFLESWKIHLNQRNTRAFAQDDLNVLDIEIGRCVSDIGPLDLVREPVKEHAKLIFVLLRQVKISVEVVG